MVIETDRLKIKDVSILQMKNYIELYWYIALRSKSKVGEGRMVFNGISKVFSTKDDRQYETIGAFWDEFSKKYGREKLRGLGYNWTTDTIEYVIGLKSGDIDNANCSVVLPNSGWIAVKGKTAELDMIYQEIYADGVLTYEIETFTDEGECEILYYR